MSPDRRIATLLAALWQLELDATDDALIVLDRVCGLLLSHAAREHKDRRYGELPDLDRDARRLRAAVLVLLDPPAGGIEELWSAIDRHVSRSELERAAATVHQLASEPDDSDGQEAARAGGAGRGAGSPRRVRHALGAVHRPRAKLLSGPAWTAARPELCAGLSLEVDPQQALERLGAQLDGAYRQTAERLPANVALQIAELAGADRPDLSKLEALDEPEQLSALRATTTAMLPSRVAFSEVLLEVCRWTGFADAFTHLSEGLARAQDLHISICAVLLAEACNISLAEVANPGIPALAPSRLSWVSQNYVRAETIAQANELLLDVYRRIPLVGALGDGHIATVDGMRFRVPVRSIHTGPNPRYFARGRGVTWLNYLTDQFAGLHAICRARHAAQLADDPRRPARAGTAR